MIIAATRYGKVGGSSGGGLPPYSFTGVGPVTREDSETGDWEMAFLGNCTISFSKDVDVDVFAVGGGQAGGGGSAYTLQYAYGGDGGNGGGIVNRSMALSKDTAYSVAIGGSGASTTAFGLTAEAGGSSNGGNGARMGTDQAEPLDPRDSSEGGPGAYAFGDANTQYNPGTKYGAGGGGGGCAMSASNTKAASNGGNTGGGSGGVGDPASAGSAGQSNTGSGGGGGGGASHYGGQWGATGAGGLGGSGIVIIRNARNST